MQTTYQAGPFTIAGVSVGGTYTSLCVPELDAIFDVGMALRSLPLASNLFLSHGHADHVGALISLLGIRGLARAPAPRIFLPQEIRLDIEEGVAAFNRSQRRSLPIEYVPMSDGEVVPLGPELSVKAFRTIHSVPSLGYELFRNVRKLRPEFVGLPPSELRTRRERGDDLFYFERRSELAYVTDTLVDVLDREPGLYDTKVLILECTFLDERKSRIEARDKAHIHLDEILERADLFRNQALVLMHFSQIYRPIEVHDILKRRLPSDLARRTTGFAPDKGPFPG